MQNIDSKFALFIVLSLSACGGKVIDANVNDAAVDTQIDTWGDLGDETALDTDVADIGIDTFDSGPPCPSEMPTHHTACPLEGQSCTYKGCITSVIADNRATCIRGPYGQVWIDQLTCLEGCPYPMPAPGSACHGPSKCHYENACGGTDVAYCAGVGSPRTIEYGGCTGGCPTLPTWEPAVGDPCKAVGSCAYVNRCGGWDTVFCNGSGKVLSIDVGTCGGCPKTAPTSGSKCNSLFDCSYSNGCGGTITATCNGTSYVVTTGPCSTPTCPADEPAAGSPCSGPLKCNYKSACGAYDIAYCDSESTLWGLIKGTCP